MPRSSLCGSSATAGKRTAACKDGHEPEDWDAPKRRQKDTDARWTKKHGKSSFVYKNHIDVDAEHTLIRDFEATPANVHDSPVFDDVIDPGNHDPQVWADSAT